MPWRDGTGPMGAGPMTGRGMGPCGRGAGSGFGRGFGRGFAWRQYNPQPARQPMQIQYTKEDEVADLKAEKELLERDLKAIETRLKELENKK